MRRSTMVVLSLATLVPIVATLVAVTTVPRSAYALPTFEFDSPDGPIRMTAAEFGATRDDDGLHIDAATFDAALGRLRKAFTLRAKAGTYELLPDHTVHLRGGSPGMELDPEATRLMLIRAMRGSRSNLEIPMRPLPPSAAPDSAIVVSLQDFRLDLYRGSTLVKHYPVGVGALRFPTPPGAYYVRSKAANPTWRNPGSGWSRSMPAFIPPGPRNPLGTRALRLDRGALVIHGTPQPWTIGTRSSHGCIRMKRPDIEDLFERVPVETPVFIVP